jgi:DNA-binding response OmpR family regulator
MARVHDTRPRLLLVEDDPKQGLLIGQVLDEVYSVTLVTDGGEGMRVALGEDFDVMIVDRRGRGSWTRRRGERLPREAL